MIVLLVLFSVLAYLVVGTLYARANAQLCYAAAARMWAGRGGDVDLVNRSYRERVALHVLAWPAVWPTMVIGRVTNAPVGDLQTAYQCWQLTQDQMKLGRKELEW